MKFVTWIGALLALALALPAAAQPSPPGLEIEPYAFQLADGSELAAERGRFSVPEDRGDPASRQIEIGFVRFRSTSAAPGNPIVYLAGGPGGSGVGTAHGPRQPIFLALREVADVILLDQRGVGLSNTIPRCTADHALSPDVTLSEAALTQYYRETLETCAENWRSAGVAVAGYTTEQSADDLEDLRRALGAERIDLWAISYGTHLGLATMRRHPGSIGRVAFASVEGMSQTVKLPSHVDAVFARIGAALDTDLPGLMRRVHARFDAEPQRVSFTAPDGTPMELRVDSFGLRMLAGYLAKNPDGHAGLLAAYRALEAGRTEALAPLIWQFFYRQPLAMTGMPELMDIASGIDEARLSRVNAEAPSTLTGTALNFPMPQLRGAVPGLDLGDDFRREVTAGHETLWFAGDLDVRTPIEEQEIAMAGLRHRHRILVRNGGHDLFEAHPEVPGLLVDFFAGRPVTVTELSLPAPAAN